MSGSFKCDTVSTSINDRLQHGKFRSIVTVSKDDKFADFTCSDAVYGGSDAACIQAALDYISNLDGGHLYITGGHYYCNSQLVYTNSNLILTGDCENTILDFTGAASGLWCIYIHGDIQLINSVLTSDANFSDLFIAVGDGSKFTTGDWVRIRSEAYFNEGTHTRLGEIKQIKSIDVNSLQLTESLNGNYGISDLATVDKINIIENITIKDLKIIATNSQNNFGIIVAQVHNVVIKNVKIEDFANRAIFLIDTIAANITACTIKRSNLAGLGYGISPINASRDILVTNNIFYDCRHAVACGGDNTYGVQYNQIYSNNLQSYSSLGQGMFGQHNTYYGMVVSNNTVIGDGLGYFDAINTLISNNYVSCGLGMYGILSGGYAKHTTIENNQIYMTHSASYGIKLNSTHGTSYSDTVVNNNHIVGQTAIYSECDLYKVSICGNYITAAYSGIYIRNSGGTCDASNLVIDNNNIIAALCIRVEPYTYNINNTKICNNYCKSTDESIYLWWSTAGGKLNTALVDNNVCDGGTYGIVLNGALNTKIKNNFVSNATIGISVRYSCLNYSVLNNEMVGCGTPFSDLTASETRKIHGNVGYTTENSGTVTLLATTTSIIVSHGLAATPTNVSITPKGNVGSCWWDTPTPTTFIIHCSSAPASDVDVNWTAIV